MSPMLVVVPVLAVVVTAAAVVVAAVVAFAVGTSPVAVESEESNSSFAVVVPQVPHTT